MSEQNNEKIKGMYNNQIPEKYKNDYEFYRWFKTERLRLDYYMTYKAIKYHVDKITFDNCFELGPGPGTWSKILYKKNPKANFQLVDISEEMKRQFIFEMRNQNNIDYKVGDFLDLDFEKKYNFFFSSRAIEYINDKEKAIMKIHSLLVSGGVGLIVTKNNNFGFKKNNDNRWQHKDKLTSDRLATLLVKYNFKDIKFYPVIIRTPIFDRLKLNYSEKLFNKIYNIELKSKHNRFIESFIVKFNK